MHRKNTQQTSDLMRAGIKIFFIFILIVITAQYLRNLISSNVPNAPRTPQITVVEEDIKAEFTIASIECINEEKVDYAIVNLIIDGGPLPYELTLINSKPEVKGPFSIGKDDIPVQIKVYGGETFTAYIIASNNKAWKGSITIPAEDPFCQLIINPTITPSFTLTILATNTNIPTSSSTYTTTPTSIIIDSTPTPRNNQTGEPDIIPTSVAISKTPTTPPMPVLPTNTPAQPTEMPKPPTSTPVHSTYTPIPIQTNTPFNPNPKACEDGIDNDGDNLVDYPNDPQCTKPGDQHEDK